MFEENIEQIITTGRRPTLQLPWTNNSNVLNNEINALTARYGEERYDLAVTLASNHLQSGKLNIILLFGDGDIYGFAEPPRTQILNAVASATRYGKAVVFTFGTGIANSTNLQEIAQAGNGDYYDFSSSAPISTIFNNLKNIADGWIEPNK